MHPKQIRAISYIPLGENRDVKTHLKDLDPCQKDHVGAQLQIGFLNALYAGRARFFIGDKPPAQNLFQKTALVKPQ